MALGAIPYSALRPLIREHLTTDEDDEARTLIRRLRMARRRGYLTRSELEAVCYWKSARAIRHIRSNTPGRIRGATKRALSTRSERRRLEALVALRGVSVPMASAVLALVDPRRYGVIDIRVWQLLHQLGIVTEKPSGVGFGFRNWYQFLMIIRYFSKRFGVKARDIERTLFVVHRKYQTGRLYPRTSRRPER